MSYGLWEKNATGKEMKEGVPSSPSLFLLFSLLKVGGSLPWPNRIGSPGVRGSGGCGPQNPASWTTDHDGEEGRVDL